MRGKKRYLRLPPQTECYKYHLKKQLWKKAQLESNRCIPEQENIPDEIMHKHTERIFKTTNTDACMAKVKFQRENKN